MKINKVHHLLHHDGRTYHAHTDMILLDGIPCLVFEWSKSEDGRELPFYLVKLDPQFLHEGNYGEANYIYEHPISDPRPLPEMPS